MILTLIAFIVILSILVIVHEFGHFLFARLCGIEVKEFAVGFGPKICTLFKQKNTEFNVRAYPLGGFVSMVGESLEDMEAEKGFQSQPAWKRFLVVFAGPLFSFLFACLIFIFLGCTLGFPTGEVSNKIQMVMPGTRASEIGLHSGDEIISVDGITKPKDFVQYIHNNPHKEMTIKALRGKKELSIKSAPSLMVAFCGVNCKETKKGVAFDSVDRDSIIYKKGIVNNDILLSVNGVDINSTKDLKNILESEPFNLNMVILQGENFKTINVPFEPYYYKYSDCKLYFPEKIFIKEKDTDIKSGDELLSINENKISNYKDFDKYSQDFSKSISVLRNKNEINIPINKKINWEKVNFVSVGAFGFIPAPCLIKTNVIDSVKMGSAYIGSMIMELFKVLTSREIKDNVGGPIAIVSATNSAVNTGMFSIVILMGGLSLSLAILNLLPIPVLDGGHIFIMFLEFIRRKRFTKEQLLTIQAIGLFIIVMIFVVVMYSDISKLWTGALPK